LQEFRENKRYDVDYYWDRIITPIIEIISVVCPQSFHKFKDCFNYSEKQFAKKIEELDKEQDNDMDE
jgi:CO dehydrogenase/acetyl-CoA synthase alpha subunit